MIKANSLQLSDIKTCGPGWQVRFSAMFISGAREDPSLLEDKLGSGGDIMVIKNSISILGLEVDFKLSVSHHLETVASMRVKVKPNEAPPRRRRLPQAVEVPDEACH